MFNCYKLISRVQGEKNQAKTLATMQLLHCWHKWVVRKEKKLKQNMSDKSLINR